MRDNERTPLLVSVGKEQMILYLKVRLEALGGGLKFSGPKN